MGKPFAQAGGQNPDLLITTINQAWNKAGVPEGVLYPEVCYVANGGGVIEEYPMHVAAVSEKDVDDTAERDFSTAYVIDVTSRSKRIDGPATLLPLSESRGTAFLEGAAPSIIRRGDRMWDRRLAKVMNANPVCYDGKAIYATDHPVNPSVAGSGTYSNDLSNTDLDEAGLTAAFQALLDIPGADGNRYNADLGVPTIVVPTEQLALKARKLLNEGLIAKVFGANTAAASESTQLVGRAAVQLLPELNDPAVNSSNKRWYVIRNNAKPAAGWIVRITRRPQMMLTKPTDHLAVSRNALALFYWAEGGVDPGLPQVQVRCTTP